MKKSSRFAIITGLVLILVALAWSGFSWQRIQDDTQRISQKDYKEKQTTFTAGATERIHVNVDNVRIVVKTHSDSSTIRVVYFTSENDAFAVTNSDKTVSVTRTKEADPHFMCFFRCIGTPGTITVYVPAGSKYAYDLTAENAPVTFDNTKTLSVQSMRIESSNSSIEMRRLLASGDVELQSDNGSIKLLDVEITGKLHLTSSNASNELTRVTAASINSQTDNGSASLDSVTTKDLTVGISNASIKLHRLDAQHSTLNSDNGSVECSLIGSKDDYSIKIGSDNGSIKLDGAEYNGSYFSDGNKNSKSISAQSSNASVTLTFVK